MITAIRNLTLYVKVAALGAGSVLLAAGALLALAVWQSGRYNTLARQEVEGLIAADLDHITQGVYNLVQTENEAVQQQVDANLNVAIHVLAGGGPIRLARETADWWAVNQFSGEKERVRLPRLLVGGRWLGQNTDPARPTLIVDEITRLVGETATIFQRMNADGDMLRVATTIRAATGKRAIGTYIPARLPDDTVNPVVAAVLAKKTYNGRAFVVDDWYLTAYAPLTDTNGAIVGMVYVGVRQKALEARVRQAILQTKVGRTGYIYVLGGRGEKKGRYIISQHEKRDGEDIWNTRDSDGRYVIQSIIAKAVALKPGESATERYRWQNPGETTPRWKIARLVYFEPWDWVIGTSVYEDELQTYYLVLSEGRGRMIRTMSLAGLLITLTIGLIGLFTAWTIVRPVRRMQHAVGRIVDGDLRQTVEVESGDEIGDLARSFNEMTARLSRSLQEVHRLNAELERRVVERTQQLEAANKELEAFSYSVSHDLRAPLRSIDGFSQALLEDYSPTLDTQGQNYIHRVRHACQRMAQLIDDLLTLSRLTRSEMHLTTVDLSAMVREIAERLKAGEPQRRVEFVISPGLTACADPNLLRIALNNLLGNAWKFTAKHESARIEFGAATASDAESVFCVRDDGAGFDMAYAAKLFGAFQRLHSAAEFEGVGIGLATVQRVIHRHGGRVWAESAPEQGAAFFFTLPLQRRYER